MLNHLLTLAGASFAALLPIANPFSTAPLFVAITRHMPRKQRMEQARMACVYMSAILLVTLLAGSLILKFFGISVEALRIAGGLIVAKIGFGMLSPTPEPKLSDEHQAAAMVADNVAFTPLAMPMLSGPGSIAVTIGLTTGADTLGEYFAVAAGIILVAIVAWLVLRSATHVVDYLGPTGVTVLTRIMGLLLVCIGIVFIFGGIIDSITEPRTMRLILDSIEQARQLRG